MKLWPLLAACLLVPGLAAAQNDTNESLPDFEEEPVEGGDGGGGWSPLLVLAVIVGLALLIGVIIAIVGRD